MIEIIHFHARLCHLLWFFVIEVAMYVSDEGQDLTDALKNKCGPQKSFCLELRISVVEEFFYRWPFIMSVSTMKKFV